MVLASHFAVLWCNVFDNHHHRGICKLTCTCPLCAGLDKLEQQLAQVKHRPAFALMAAFPHSLELPFAACELQNHPDLQFLSCDSSKPVCLVPVVVLNCGSQRSHLSMTQSNISKLLLNGTWLPAVRHVVIPVA